MPQKNRQQRKLAKQEVVERSPHWLDWQVVAFVVAVKVFVIIFGVVSYSVLTNKPVGGYYGWLERWNYWDGPHYIDIARDGYVTTDIHSHDQRLWIVFFPLYPWLIRLLSIIFRDFLVSAHVLSLIGCLATGLLMQRLVELDFDKKIARSAVVFFFIFPTAYFFHAVYTESVFMPLMLGCFLAARKERWAVAGGLGALASMTRVNGLLLIPAMAVEAYMQYRRDGRRLRWEWLWILFAGMGFLVYLAINYHVWGDPFYFQKVLEKYWFKKLTWPWVGIGKTLEWIWNASPAQSHLVGIQEFGFIMLGLACTIWCWLRLRPSYSVWMTLNWLLITSTSFIMSTPRYVLSLFPIYILLARLSAERPLWGTIITVWSLIFFALFAGQFAQGQWAF